MSDDIALIKSQIKNLETEIKKLERYKQYSETANEMFAIKEAYKAEGFTEEEAMELLIMLTKTCLNVQ